MQTIESFMSCVMVSQGRMNEWLCDKLETITVQVVELEALASFSSS